MSSSAKPLLVDADVVRHDKGIRRADAVSPRAGVPVAVRTSHLYKAFLKDGKTPLEVLRDVNLTVAAGEFVALLGPSGCGKSTLLNVLAGTTEKSAGDVSIEAEDGQRVRSAYVFQGNSVLPWRTTLQNVAMGTKGLGLSRREAQIEGRRWVEHVGLGGFEDAFPTRLSGGMRKRVSLATAFCHRPSILFMDEPFGAIDAQTKTNLQDMLLELWEESRCTVIFVTHDIEEAILLADRIVVMARGPGRIHAEHDVPLPRPRELQTVRFDAEFRDLYRSIWSELEQQGGPELGGDVP